MNGGREAQHMAQIEQEQKEEKVEDVARRTLWQDRLERAAEPGPSGKVEAGGGI